MGTQRTTVGKLERDRARKAKAAAKRERRQERRAEAAASAGDVAATAATDDGGLSAARLLEEIEEVHRRYESGAIGLEEFEAKKADLLARLPLD
jgi:Short C-terminal domain